MDSAICTVVRVPNRAYLRFEAHEGEINSVKWSPHGLNVATGGSDRKIKLWDVSKGVNTLCSTLRGSNGSIMSIDYDSGQRFFQASSKICIKSSVDVNLQPEPCYWRPLMATLPAVCGQRTT